MPAVARPADFGPSPPPAFDAGPALSKGPGLVPPHPWKPPHDPPIDWARPRFPPPGGPLSAAGPAPPTSPRPERRPLLDNRAWEGQPAPLSDGPEDALENQTLFGRPVPRPPPVANVGFFQPAPNAGHPGRMSRPVA